MLLIKLEVATWKILLWNQIIYTADLHAIDKGIYWLEELDETPLASTFVGDELKKFPPRQKLRLGYEPDFDHKIVLNFWDLLALESDDALSELHDFFDPW